MPGNTSETILKGDMTSRKENGDTEQIVKRKDSRRVSFNTEVFPKIVDRQIVEIGSASLKRVDSDKDLEDNSDSGKFKTDRRW